MSDNVKLNQLREYVSEENRVCPNRIQWNQLWEMLPNRERTEGGGWEPPAPLILAAWHVTSNLEKKDRFLLHLEYAHQHGVIEQVDYFVRGLRAEQWHTYDKHSIEGR